jgi:hypothetical protein
MAAPDDEPAVRNMRTSCRNEREHADQGWMYVGMENSPTHGLLLPLGVPVGILGYPATHACRINTFGPYRNRAFVGLLD